METQQDAADIVETAGLGPDIGDADVTEDIKPGPGAGLATSQGTYTMQMDDKTRLALWDKYISEMTLPNETTDYEWSENNGISPRTLRRWKGLKKFKERQRRWVNDTHFSTGKMAAIWANMFKVASTEQGPHAVAAAKMYAENAAKWEPPKPNDDDGPAEFETMSVAELHAAALALGMDSDTADVS